MGSGQELLQGGTADELQALRDYLNERAAAARESIVAFMEFVMRAEHTRARIRVVPHQRVMLDFIQAHDRSVVIVAIGHSKTFTLVALTLWLLGRDPTSRGVIVCASEAQAKKVLAMVRDYIEGAEGAELGLVFPELRRSSREGDPWTQTAITVERPPGIKDPSLTAVGVDTERVQGSRLSWVIVDDILNQENTATKEQRDKVHQWLDTTIVNRLDPKGAGASDSKLVVTNSPWHVDDIPHRLERAGWPTLRMNIDGDITVQDDVLAWRDARQLGLPWRPWDSDDLRPADPHAPPTEPDKPSRCRLARRKDPENRCRLWPERFTDEAVADLHRRHPNPIEFNRMYRCIVHDDDLAQCKREWIDLCLENARKAGAYSMAAEYKGEYLTTTGVDLAVSPGEESDDCCFFTVEFRPKGFRRILDIDVGKYSGPLIIKKLFEKHRAYNSIIRVENNAAQDFIRQFALDKDVSLPVRPHTTGRAKAHPEHGVQAVFTEISNGAWLIPNDQHGRMHPHVQRFVEECLYYAPSKHTGDVLMAAWFAQVQGKKFGADSGEGEGSAGGGTESLGMSIMSR
jgi:hypothetical protein